MFNSTMAAHFGLGVSLDKAQPCLAAAYKQSSVSAVIHSGGYSIDSFNDGGSIDVTNTYRSLFTGLDLDYGFYEDGSLRSNLGINIRKTFRFNGNVADRFSVAFTTGIEYAFSSQVAIRGRLDVIERDYVHANVDGRRWKKADIYQLMSSGSLGLIRYFN
ncbi:MAG: hypothetical protein VXY77_01820 [Pseudomonadota bacterium]|nr:hypothetical protein [Pseudomonadota bacterium]